MRTLLVTGGAGFIGGCFVRQVLAEEGVRIVNLDKLTYAGNLDSLATVMDHPSHVFVHGDVGDRPFVGELLAAYRPEAIVHFAAETHVDRSIDAPLAFVETNVAATAALLVEVLAYWRSIEPRARRRFRFLHVSTDEVYGSLGPSGRFTETTPCAPNSPYAASKAASDHFVRAFHHTYGLPVLTVNSSNNYGPYQFPEKLIPLMILSAVAGKPLSVYGDGQHVRDWLYVDDHCRAIRRVIEAGEPGEVYNVGGDQERTNLDVVHAICDRVDELCGPLPHAPCRSLITFVTDRPGHDRRYAIDAGKIRTELGWKPHEDFDSGLGRTVRWYLENRTWFERILSLRQCRERRGLPEGLP